jgi:hypothetical protein
MLDQCLYGVILNPEQVIYCQGAWIVLVLRIAWTLKQVQGYGNGKLIVSYSGYNWIND